MQGRWQHDQGTPPQVYYRNMESSEEDRVILI